MKYFIIKKGRLHKASLNETFLIRIDIFDNNVSRSVLSVELVNIKIKYKLHLINQSI